MRLRLFALLFTWVASLAAASVAQAAPESLHGAGLLLFEPKLRKGTAINVYAKADKTSEVLGLLKIAEEPRPGWTFLVTERTVENPDAGWFGDKTKVEKTVTPFTEYTTTSAGVIGVYVDEPQPDWLKLEHGWIRRVDSDKAQMKFVSWKEAMTNKHLPEFHLPTLRAEQSVLTIEAMREKAAYVPIGKLSVKNGPDGDEIVLAEKPLRLAILKKEGDWLKVFVVQSRCGDGARDYREGTTGWIPYLSREGRPVVFAERESCE